MRESWGLWACWAVHQPIECLGHIDEPAPVRRFSPKYLDTLSKKPATCSDILCMCLILNCSSRSSQRLLTSLNILASRIFSKSLPIASKTLVGRRNKDSGGSIACFRMETTRGCFHTGGKWWVRKIALKSASKSASREGEYAWGLYSVHSYGQVPCLLWDYEAFRGSLTWACFRVHRSMLQTHITNRMTAVFGGSITGWNLAARLSAKALAFSQSESAVPPRR